MKGTNEPLLVCSLYKDSVRVRRLDKEESYEDDGQTMNRTIKRKERRRRQNQDINGFRKERVSKKKDGKEGGTII